MLLKLAACAYVVGLIATHASFGTAHVWGIAAFFSIAMNGTYPWAAWQTGDFIRKEVGIALGLVAIAILGLIFSPLLVIASIFLHGVWDLFKHAGQGVPFFRWYTLGCVTVDWIYAATLVAYWALA